MRSEHGNKAMTKEQFNDKWTPEPNSGCWLWFARTKRDGYGILQINNQQVFAHRLAWQLYKGDIPAGLDVCHHCDTPACVNPEHLFVGTHVDNMRDRDSKGRNPGNPKLTVEQVREIRALLSSETHRAIADRFNVHNSTISRINTGTYWKDR